MYSRSEVIAIVLIVLAWVGALSLFSLLIYARLKFGGGKSRTIGAILIDIGMTFGALVLVLGLLPFVRIFAKLDTEPWTTVVRFGNIISFLGVIWFAVIRLFVFFLIGDSPIRPPWRQIRE